jgi:hypothetical protein
MMQRELCAKRRDKSVEIFVDAVATQLELHLLLQLLLGQLLVRLLLQQDRLLQVVHHLQHHDHLLLPTQTHALKVTTQHLRTPGLQLGWLEVSLLVYALPQHQQISLHSLSLLLHDRFELPEGVLSVPVGLLPKVVRQGAYLFLDSFEKKKRNANTLGLVQFKEVQYNLVHQRTLTMVFEEQVEPITLVVFV